MHKIGFRATCGITALNDGSRGLYDQQELSKYFLMTTPQQQRRNNHYRKRSWVYRPYKGKKQFSNGTAAQSNNKTLWEQ